MAKLERIQFVDDLDGRPIDPDDVNTVEFEVKLPGRRAAGYVLDLRGTNAAKFEKDLSKYVSHATKLTSPGTSGRRGQASPSRTQTIRRWGLDNGYDLAPRGRIPAHVIAAFDAEHR